MTYPKTNPKVRFRPEPPPRGAAVPSVFQPAELFRRFAQPVEDNRNVASVKMELFFSVHGLSTEKAEAIISNEQRRF
jgi:hypothetical protein